LSRSIKNNRPTIRGALVEVLLVLAVGMVTIGVYRGWLSHSGDSRMNANEPWKHAVRGEDRDSKSKFRGLWQVVTESPIAQGTNHRR